MPLPVSYINKWKSNSMRSYIESGESNKTEFSLATDNARNTCLSTGSYRTGR